MKITKSQLKQLIQEELEKALDEVLPMRSSDQSSIDRQRLEKGALSRHRKELQMKCDRGDTKACDKLKTLEEKNLNEKDLSAKERRDLPDSDFALAGKGEGPEGKQAGSYPIPDEKHGRMALAMVAKHGTSEEKAKVRAAVKRKFPGIEQGEG